MRWIKGRCDRCRFAKKLDTQMTTAKNTQEYYCHRFPPTLVGLGNGAYEEQWPTVLGREWCGEYKKKA